MNTFSHVPPGFRFHPTDEELVDYYLRKKIASKRIDLDVIKEVDLYKIEPWDLQELCRIGSEEQSDWYFFSHKDKKYPTGTRTNRATKAGFWKATGRDKAIYTRHSLIGMRKTLVFYKGRAPNGQKSDWIMHEYRLETNENGTPQEEGWAVCRVFKKRMTTVRKMSEYDSPCWYDDQLPFMPTDGESPRRISHEFYTSPYHPHPYPGCKQELDHQLHHHHPHQHYNIPPQHHHDPFLQLPQLESPKLPQSAASVSVPYGNSTLTTTQDDQQLQQNLSSIYSNSNNNGDQAVDQVTDWRVLDKFVASQFNHGDHSAKETNYSNSTNLFNVVDDDQQMELMANDHDHDQSKRQEQEYALTSTSSCQIDLWK